MVQTAPLASEPVGQRFGSFRSSPLPPGVSCQSLGGGQFPRPSRLIPVPGAPTGQRAGPYFRGAVFPGAGSSSPDAQACLRLSRSLHRLPRWQSKCHADPGSGEKQAPKAVGRGCRWPLTVCCGLPSRRARPGAAQGLPQVS